MKPSPHVLCVPADAPFVQALAAWISERYPPGESLAQVRVLLPNRRACRALREAFLELSVGTSMLLPRIQPIGDWESDVLPSDLLGAEALSHILPAIDANRRLLLLARLVMQFEQKREGIDHYLATQAIQLARQLGRFLDDIAREDADIHSLPLLAPADDLARHWQQTVDFLRIVSVHWPEMLKGEHAIDPVEHRNRVLHAVAAAWQDTPPGYSVIAAGSTGTQPATAALLATIARLPQGMVILPGLDTSMPDAEWEVVSPTHPQFALKTLLKHLGVSRKDIDVAVNLPKSDPARLQCLRTIFQPAAITAEWAQTDVPLAKGLQGVKLIVADTLADEARQIAVILRETLEIPGKTAALVTPDRALARRVVGQMQRFGIAIDDSAGVPLLDTPPGVFLQLLAEALLSRFSPVQLLALLRHPLAAAGMDPAICRSLSRILDKEYLRGVRRTPGLKPLCEATKNDNRELHVLLAALESKAKIFSSWLAGKKLIAPSALLKEHLAFAEWLATTPEETGESRLWAGDAGNQLAAKLAKVLEHADALPTMYAEFFPVFFRALLAEEVFRPRYGKHPRLHILSPIEARLMQFDRVVLGGLNEGMWPARPAADPWMSRPMREAFGLPPLDRCVGQSAHDFFQLAAAPEVFLTRSRKVDGKPTVASRWLVRMETLLTGKDATCHKHMTDNVRYETAKAMLDMPEALTPLVRPEPKPPRAARLRRIHATAIETWQRDPYMIYAKHILKLRKLDALDEEPDTADFGNVVHAALKLFTDRFPDALPDNAYEALLVLGKKAFAPLENRAAVSTLWWPRFEALAVWFIEQEKLRRAKGISIFAEREGSLPIDIGNESFALTARIDRLEVDKNDNATLIDYKTGALPKDSDVEKVLTAQLPIEALISTEGVLNPPLTCKVNVTGMEYWRLAGSATQCKIKPLDNVATLMATCKEMLTTLLTRYADPAQPFSAATNAKQLPRYNDYAHLTRRQEWGEM